jgi:hypothetical protein
VSDSIRELRPEPHPDVIAALERSLEDAKAGKVRSVTVAAIGFDGSYSAGWGGHNTFWEKIGLLESMKFEMLADTEHA